MANDRFTIRHYGNGGWDIADRDFASLPDEGYGPARKMQLQEAERVVLLMNELDRRLRAKHAMSSRDGTRIAL